LLLPLVLAAIAYPFIPSSSTWLTLTIAGLRDGHDDLRGWRPG